MTAPRSVVLRMEPDEARAAHLALATTISLMDQVDVIPPDAPLYGQRDRLAGLARRLDHEINHVDARSATEFSIIREPDDRLVPARASIGGAEHVGFYLVFRGEPEAVLDAVRKTLAEAEKALPSGRYQDKRGRPQG